MLKLPTISLRTSEFCPFILTAREYEDVISLELSLAWSMGYLKVVVFS